MQFVPTEPADTLRFLLHGDLDLQSLSSPRLASYAVEQNYNPYGLDTSHVQLVSAVLKNTADAGSAVPLRWTYGGTYDNEHFQLGPSTVRPHWAELEIGALWVPVVASLKHRFTSTTRVTLPEEYDVVSSGSVQRAGETWTLRAAEPQVGVPLLASDRVHSVRTNAGQQRIDVYHTGASDALVAFVADRTARVMRFYQNLFNADETDDVLRVVLPPAGRSRPQAYARPQLIVLTHGAERSRQTFGFVAHEAAHLWWNNTDDSQSRHNFLNEAFAEYTSVLARRDAYGEEAFQERIDRARQKAKDLPSISKWTPSRNKPLMYEKGPYLLYQLHERIGDDRFTAFLRMLLARETGTIEGMLSTLEAAADEETAAWFEEML